MLQLLKDRTELVNGTDLVILKENSHVPIEAKVIGKNIYSQEQLGTYSDKRGYSSMLPIDSVPLTYKIFLKKGKVYPRTQKLFFNTRVTEGSNIWSLTNNCERTVVHVSPTGLLYVLEANGFRKSDYIANYSSRKPTDEEMKELDEIVSYFDKCSTEVIKRDVLDDFTGIANTHSAFLKYSGDSWYWFQDCIASSKRTSDFHVYIPEQWTNFYGYSTENIKEWLEFCNNVFGSPIAKYQGINETLDMDIKKGIREMNGGRIESMKNYYTIASAGKYLSKDNLNFHQFLVYANKTNPMNTYMRYICLRYLHDWSYAHLPRICMDMRKKLPESITNWQIILMANTYRNHYNYYNLMSPMICRLNQTMEEVASRAALNSGGSPMNESFIYTNELPEATNEFWESGDYEGLYKFISSLP